MKWSKSCTGKRAEQLACDFLSNKGLLLRTRNYHCGLGEIDLIMEQDQTIIFVEVRYRENERFVTAVETITTQKQQRIIKAATHYLQSHRCFDEVDCRFDVVTIGADGKLDWIENAFGVE